MPDIFNPLDGLSSFFFGKDKSDPRVNPALRQKIALALMARDRKFPKNTGEGLAAIGDAIGDRALMRQLMDADVGQQDQVKELLGGGGATPGAAPAPLPPTPYAPPSPLASAPASQAIDAAITPRPPMPVASVAPPLPSVPAQPPPGLVNTPNQPPSMLSPDAPQGLAGSPEGQLATAPPEVQRSMMSPQPMLGQRMRTPPATGFNPAPVPPPPPGQGGQSLSAPPVDPNEVNNLDANIGRRAAIAGIESGGARNPYALLGAQTGSGDRAYGKYQVMGANVPSWTQAALGRPLTPQQFLADKDAQDAVFDQRFGNYVNKYGEGGAAKAWYAGEKGMKNPNATDVHGRLTVSSYGQDYLNRLNRGQPTAPRDAVAGALMAQQGGGGQPAPPEQPALAFSGIQPAPPDPSSAIRPAPTQLAQAQPAPTAGYVPPDATDPTGAPIVPMHPEEVKLRKILQAHPNNTYLPAEIAARIEPYVKEREIRQNEANERYKAEIARVTKQKELREQAQISAAERAANAAHTQAQTNKETIIEMPDGNKYRQGPDGVMRPIQIEGQTDAEPILPKNEFQLKSMKHYEQMKEADKIIGSADALRNGASATGSQVPLVGGYLQSDAYRKQRAAAERWVINKLRQESGATIGEKELDREVKAYFPVPSDDAKTAADKAAARKVASEGMMEASGREGKAYLTWKEKKAAEAETAKKSEIADAVQWLKDNPNSPKAAAIRKRLGL